MDDDKVYNWSPIKSAVEKAKETNIDDSNDGDESDPQSPESDTSEDSIEDSPQRNHVRMKKRSKSPIPHSSKKRLLAKDKDGDDEENVWTTSSIKNDEDDDDDQQVLFMTEEEVTKAENERCKQDAELIRKDSVILQWGQLHYEVRELKRQLKIKEDELKALQPQVKKFVQLFPKKRVDLNVMEEHELKRIGGSGAVKVTEFVQSTPTSQSTKQIAIARGITQHFRIKVTDSLKLVQGWVTACVAHNNKRLSTRLTREYADEKQSGGKKTLFFRIGGKLMVRPGKDQSSSSSSSSDGTSSSAVQPIIDMGDTCPMPSSDIFGGFRSSSSSSSSSVSSSVSSSTSLGGTILLSNGHTNPLIPVTPPPTIYKKSTVAQPTQLSSPLTSLSSPLVATPPPATPPLTATIDPLSDFGHSSLHIVQNK